MTLEPTPAELSDGTLLERIAIQRSQDAFAQLFSRYERSLFSLSVQLTGDRNLAAEAIQNSAVDIWLSASSYRPDGNARGWIFRIVVRHSMKLVRTRRKAESQMDPKAVEMMTIQAESPAESAARAETLISLQAALNELPALSRQVVALYYGAELSQREIGTALSIPERTVSHKLQEALAALRSGMTKAGFAAAVPAVLDSSLAEALLSAHDAPTGLREKILVTTTRTVRESLRTAASQSRRVAVVKSSAAFVWTLTAALTLAAGGAVWWQSTREKSPQPRSENQTAVAPVLPQATAAVTPLNRSWDFNTPEAPRDIKVTNGNWHWVSDGGPDKSGCMETEEPLTTIVLDFPIPRLPVLVSMRVRDTGTTNGTWGIVHWSADQGIADFHNISEMRTKTGQWVECTYYVTEKFIGSIWNPGNEPLHFSYMSRHGDARLAIGFAKAVHRIDDVKIREIQPDQVPDFSAYVNAVEKIEPSRRVGEVPVPELKSARPPNPVTISFIPATKAETGDRP
jgi:RNA polymerase sigma-70 factor (ECF subfamily)